VDCATVFTIGHSTRSVEEMTGLLGEANVRVVADVRAFPSSRRHPQFNRDALVQWLAAAGLEYAHLPGLGGRRSPVPGSLNTAWRETAFQGYADHMSTPEFKRALAELESVARDRATAIMCAEAVWWQCHRQLIADALVARGHEVRHIMSGGNAPAHTLTAFARVADGRVTYPGVV
jgi:uncharacterized protein (DUF488 family)